MRRENYFERKFYHLSPQYLLRWGRRAYRIGVCEEGLWTKSSLIFSRLYIRGIYSTAPSLFQTQDNELSIVRDLNYQLTKQNH